MNAFHKITCASLVIAGVGGAAPSLAAEVNPKFAIGVNEANAKVRDGDFDGALTRYAEVQQFAPESADLSYNMAVARYRKGEVAAAESLFQAAATSENDSLAAKARYNLGNCNYTSGLELAQKDRPAAIEELESAIENYRSSLAVEPNNADARANIELAAQLIEKLREDEKQQQQQQQQQQQNQDQQSQDQQQQDNQQQSQESDDQQKQNEQQQNQQQENQDEQHSQQQSNNEQSQDQQQQEQQQQQQDSQSQSSQDEQQQKQQQSQNEQQQDQSQQEQSQQNKQQPKEQQQDSAQQNEQQSAPQDQSQDNQPQQQQQSQQRRSQPPQQPQDESAAPEEMKEDEIKQPPEGELTAATEDEAKAGKEQKPVAAFDPSKDGEMTREEAEKMLQAIRDREMLRRYQRRQQEMRQHIPVDRDW